MDGGQQWQDILQNSGFTPEEQESAVKRAQEDTFSVEDNHAKFHQAIDAYKTRAHVYRITRDPKDKEIAMPFLERAENHEIEHQKATGNRLFQEDGTCSVCNKEFGF